MEYTVGQMGPGVLLHLAVANDVYDALLAFGNRGLLPDALIAGVPIRGSCGPAVAEQAASAFDTSTSEAALPRAMGHGKPSEFRQD